MCMHAWNVDYYTYIWYCSDTTSHSQSQHSRVQVNIYASDQAKSFESREFTQELTQLSNT